MSSSSSAISLTVRSSPRWNLSVGPTFVKLRRTAQYVTSIPDARAERTFGTRYVFAPLDQQEFGIVTRLNYTFTRDFTLERALDSYDALIGAVTKHARSPA